MTSKAKKKQMLEYIISRLEGSSEKIEPAKFKNVGMNYIRIGENGVILLINKPYGKESFKKIYTLAKSTKEKVVPIFYKDGETFFRDLISNSKFKQKRFSLKNYSNEEKQRMILFRPEEILINEKQDFMQYYQPKSERLEECIVTYQFKPVKQDHSDITVDKIKDKYPGRNTEELKAILYHIPKDIDAKTWFIWNNKIKKENSGFLRIDGYKGSSYLVKRDMRN